MSVLPHSASEYRLSPAAVASGQFQFNTDGSYCKIREHSKAKCGTTCIIIICVVCGCVLIAAAVLLCCLLACRRRRSKKEKKQRQEQEQDVQQLTATEMESAHSMLGIVDGEPLTAKAATSLSSSFGCHKTDTDAPPNPCSPPPTTVPASREAPRSENPLDIASVSTEKTMVRLCSSRIPVAESEVTSFFRGRDADDAAVEEQLREKPQAEKMSSRRVRVRSRNRCQGTAVVTCPSDEEDVIENLHD
ncbi:hypothetical protein NESM_000900400 [Novymonas esmeraldas]|uniref:Uncharacterized protein n=1 Tax=Novymonas esmeraldas TaxID=1808958 RepID=A0AAW0F252_9TRYP